MARVVRERYATVLFGAFDRHNFGDLLFPHVAAALLPDADLHFAGLAERDLRTYGGHQCRAITRLAEEFGDRPVRLIHVGGEILTCNAWEAAVMLLPPEQVQDTIARLDKREREKFEWAREMLACEALAPYVATRKIFRNTVAVKYCGIGGVDLQELPSAMRGEVLGKLAEGGQVTVRDGMTLAQLREAGIDAKLIPDPASMTAELFAGKILERKHRPELARILSAFPQGYVAVQFSADFGDDATLSDIAAQLDRTAGKLGIVFFRAGAAPWHDDETCYRRCMDKMIERSATVFESLDIWDICALIAHSSVYCGSSLHGRIVAMAFARPRVNLIHPESTGHPGKTNAYAITWEAAGLPVTKGVEEMAQAIRRALDADDRLLRQTARELASRYRDGFRHLIAAA